VSIRVLLTGERGFLGSRVRELLDADPEVEIEVLAKRLGELASGELAGFDVVVHLAGWIPKRAGASDLGQAVEANVLGLGALIAALQPAPRRLLFASTVDVYGAREDQRIDERSLLDPRGIYASSKLLGEQAFEADARERGYEACSMRIGHLYGPGEEAFEKLVPMTIRALMKGRPPTVVGDGRCGRDLLYVDDAAEAIRRLVLAPVGLPAVVNLAAPGTYSLNEIAQTLIETVGFLGAIRYLSDRPNPPTVGFDVGLLGETIGEWQQVALADGLRREVEHVVALERGSRPLAR
jgi:nucleoside-diphosphate-sugar epimerase